MTQKIKRTLSTQYWFFIDVLT